MKEIQTIHDSSNGMQSWWSRTTWYECDSIKEYQERLDAYAKEFATFEERFNAASSRHGNKDWWTWRGDDWNAGFIHGNWSLSTDIDINVRPRHRCSDAWHFYEGSHIKGHGFMVHKRYERSTEIVYIMMPGCDVQPCSDEEYLG